MNYIPFILMNLSHKLYGFFKSWQRKLGLGSAEIDDSSESLIREHGVSILIFGILFVWVVYQSFASNQDK